MSLEAVRHGVLDMQQVPNSNKWEEVSS